jgi:hypothetical protein
MMGWAAIHGVWSCSYIAVEFAGIYNGMGLKKTLSMEIQHL